MKITVKSIIKRNRKYLKEIQFQNKTDLRIKQTTGVIAKLFIYISGTEVNKRQQYGSKLIIHYQLDRNQP